ncbi:MAG: diguanylate cyclase, partial [Clostridia bacterium]|nr:diguanylate cyclase [Clostridia bacterium]
MNTLKFIAKRLLLSIVILFFVALIVYTILRCLPTSYVESIAMQKSQQPNSKTFEEWMEQLNATYGMDKGIIPGFFRWVGNAVRGQFGDSWFYTRPVTEKFASTVWISFLM